MTRVNSAAAGSGPGRRPTVLVVGSLNVDLVVHVDSHPRPGDEVIGRSQLKVAGGKGANQAVAAAAAGASVLMAGAVGDDPDGRAYLRRLNRLGIDTTAVQIRPGTPTGLAVITVDPDGENMIVLLPGANLEVDAGSVASALDRLEPGDVVLLQLEIPLDTVTAVVRAAHDRDLQVILNVAPFASLPPDVLALADVVVANQHEALRLADTGIALQSLLVTLGSAGASWDGDHRPAPLVPAGEVLDTTGAGDAFCGALASSLAAGHDRDEALDRAMAAGGVAVRHLGAQPDNAL